MATVALLATVRTQIADYLTALIDVYSVLLIAYVITSVLFSLDVRVPYSRWSNAVLSFLRDVSEPYLRVFRRVIPALGPLDLSPFVGLIVLQLVGQLVINAIHG